MRLVNRLYRKIKLKCAKDAYQYALIYKSDGVNLGKNCRIYTDVNFGSEPFLVTLGDNVSISSGTQFITHDGGVWVLRNMGLLPNADKFGQIIIGSNVSIGSSCIIMPGVSIGDNVVIGAGSIITKNIPSNSVAVGVPCKVIKDINEYYEGLKNNVDYTKDLGAKEKRDYLKQKYNL